MIRELRKKLSRSGMPPVRRGTAANGPAILVIGDGWLALQIARRIADYREAGAVAVLGPDLSAGPGESLAFLSPLAAPLSAVTMQEAGPGATPGRIRKRPFIRLLSGPDADIDATLWRQLAGSAGRPVDVAERGGLTDYGLVPPDGPIPGGPVALIDLAARLVDPSDAAERLRRRLRLAGARMIDAIPMALRTEGGRVTGVETMTETFAADQIVLADARFNRVLANSAGVELAVESRDSLMLETEPVRPFLEAAVLDTGRGVSLGQGPSGALTICEQTGFSEPAEGSAVDRERVETLARAALGLCRRLSRLRVRRWVSLPVEVTPDGAPLVGPLAVEGLFTAAGIGSAGGLIPAAADITADAVTGQPPGGDAFTVRPGRFAENGALAPPRRGHSPSGSVAP